MESKVMETLDRLALCSTSENAPTLEARKALLAAAVEDKTAHDRRIAELEAKLAAKDVDIAELEESEEATGHALVEKDRRIAEMEAAHMKDRVTHCHSIGAKNARIAELEASASGLHTRALQAEADLRKGPDTVNAQAELEKRSELPEDVAEIVNTLRRSHLVHWQAVRLVEFIDATFPKPVPKWEQYAQWVESLESTMSPIGYAYAKKVAKFIRELGAKGLIWTRKQPSSPGYYWIRYGFMEGPSDVVRVFRDDHGELRAHGTNNTDRTDIQEWWEWAGPIPHPVDAPKGE